jgi:hypothetical protein
MQSKGMYAVYKMPRNEILNSKMERERCMLNSIEDRL